MRILAALLILAAASPAAAQTVLAADVGKYDKAPWWMDQPIIASTGYVRSEVQANRATVEVKYTTVEKTAADAARVAAEKVGPLAKSLAALGAERVQIEVTVEVQPLFEQYRDREGNRVNNQRSDKIENYEGTAEVAVEVRDLSLLNQVYAALIAAKPTATDSIDFSLEPTNEVKTELYRQAVADAARRARLSVEATGARLGPVKLIDPTGRACQTDVLVAGAPRSSGPGVAPNTIPLSALERVELSRDGASATYGSNAIAGVVNYVSIANVASAANLINQPPWETLTAQACVVYALAN